MLLLSKGSTQRREEPKQFDCQSVLFDTDEDENCITPSTGANKGQFHQGEKARQIGETKQDHNFLIQETGWMDDINKKVGVSFLGGLVFGLSNPTPHPAIMYPFMIIPYMALGGNVGGKVSISFYCGYLCGACYTIFNESNSIHNQSSFSS